MTRPVRLAHVFSHDLGIGASMAYIEPLLERGWEVTSISPHGPNVAISGKRGVRWLPLSLTRTLDPVGDARGTVELYRHLRAGEFDIVHTHNIKVGLIARVVAALARSPIVVHTMHGLAYSLETPPLQRALHATFERIASVRVDRILSQSEEDRATILATHVVPPEKVTMIGNGIDLDRFRAHAFSDEDRAALRASLGVAQEEVLFLSAGRLVREKGYVELFDAAAIARQRDPRVRLCVAGRLDPDKTDALPSFVLERAAADGVLLLGERKDMPPLYAAADAIVLASWREGLPRTLMEGAAMGKPLVACDIRGCREIVSDRISGLLAKPRDAASIADALCTLASDSELRARIGEANIDLATRRFDIRAAVARVVAVYDELLGMRGRS